MEISDNGLATRREDVFMTMSFPTRGENVVVTMWLCDGHIRSAEGRNGKESRLHLATVTMESVVEDRAAASLMKVVNVCLLRISQWKRVKSSKRPLRSSGRRTSGMRG